MRTAALAAGLGVLAFGLASVQGVQKEPPAPPAAAPVVVERPIDPAIAALVKELGSDDYRAREKAGQQLAARGEKALPDLRRALAAAHDPEVARRLAVLVRKMDYDRLVAPKRVTLAVKDKSPKEVLDEISKQTGYRIEFGGGSDQKFTFDFVNAPFWQAVDQVATACGMVVYANYDDETIRIYSQDAFNPHVAYVGPFRFVAQNISTSRSVQLAGISRRGNPTRAQEHVNLNFQIHSEPKNPILGTTQAELLEATDETGASLMPPRDPNNQTRSNYYNPGYRGHNAYGGVNIVRADKSATTIKVLKGKIGIVLLAGTVPEIVIPDPVKVKAKKFAGRATEIELDSVTDAGNGTFTVVLTARKLGGADNNQEDYNWSNNLWQKLELIDAQENRYRSYGPNSINNSGNAVTMTIPFGQDGRNGRAPGKLGAPTRLVLNEWTSVTHEVTFEFRDIPLP